MRADRCVLVSSVPRNDCSPIYTIKSSKSHENLHLLVSIGDTISGIGGILHVISGYVEALKLRKKLRGMHSATPKYHESYCTLV